MWPLKQIPRVEDPERLQQFLSVLENVDWRSGASSALNKVFAALNDLVYREVLFYYKARKKQRAFSIVTRGLSVLLGSIGVMIPLLAAADPILFQSIAPYGYPFLVAAVALIAVNRMFGATGGHIRYVTAQLELERIMTKFRLAWVEWLSRYTLSSGAKATHEEVFKLMNDFVDEAYRVIQEETTVWGKSVSEALREYESRLPKQPGQGASH
ncbi:SLATT domain-containing protein [Variovorax saccharolyticus]|uniref:SLATT domain-containing protein n=1 Tax=Variovorax saccharolyticus TaxID=3053516 RepID=UPI0025787D42|nr:SLATT domain-containing protein [Variovorax sp. J31P216]MDM0029305.1 SLATT domain-containing protein [Variovorax sp. J31P216]